MNRRQQSMEIVLEEPPNTRNTHWTRKPQAPTHSSSPCTHLSPTTIRTRRKIIPRETWKKQKNQRKSQLTKEKLILAVGNNPFVSLEILTIEREHTKTAPLTAYLNVTTCPHIRKKISRTKNHQLTKEKRARAKQ